MLAIAAITGCGSKQEAKNEQGEQIYRIGISQFAEHASLDNCREGFFGRIKKEEGLEEGKNLNIRSEKMQRRIWALQVRLRIGLWQIRWI